MSNSTSTSSRMPFGHEMRDKHFLFAADWTNLNHGSYGTHPLSVRKVLRAFHEEIEARPDPFIRVREPELIVAARRAVAHLLKVPENTVVLVKNATTGINTVLRNITYKGGDVIISFSTTYGAVSNTIQSVCETTHATSKVIQLLNLDALRPSSIIAAVKNTILDIRMSGESPKVILLDTIVSQPGVRLPFECLINLCRNEGIYSVVDGAHGIGQINLHLATLDPDFLVTNAHKWLHTPRSCGVLYVPLRNQKIIRTTLPTSAFFEPKPDSSLPADMTAMAAEKQDNERFVLLFSYVGTCDNVAYFCLPAALAFRRNVCGGEDAIMSYCSDLACNGGALVAERLGTRILDFPTGDRDAGAPTNGLAMINVLLPLDPCEVDIGDGIKASDLGEGKGGKDPGKILEWMNEILVREHSTYCAGIWWGSAWWVRLSAQVYLELRDFEWIAGLLKDLCERVKRGEHLSGQA